MSTASDPLPHPRNLIQIDRARISLLTSRMFRLEWAEDGNFEDLASLRVINRATPPVPHRIRKDREGVIFIRTAHCEIEYRPDGRPFHRNNLRVRFQMAGSPVDWHPGKSTRGNLKGTTKTLDGVSGSKRWIEGEWQEIDLGTGLLSRDGWAVVDDSAAAVLDPAICDWQPWPRERPAGRRLDWYLLAHGHDYKGALREAQLIFGAQPLPPRYALGYWYSRYWAYTDQELRELVADFDHLNLPLDVLVIDMDWHKPGWTGYSWDSDYFPDPEGLLRELRQRGLQVSLNLHPADGVLDFEDAFPAMQKEMNLSPAQLQPVPDRLRKLYTFLKRDPDSARCIPLDICDPVYMRAYFKCLHHPLEQQGVDFWWMDWQQGNQGSRLPNLDTLPWINELHWQDQKRRRPNRRPINFSRYGGIGAGRMPVGFSGDTHINWDSLAFQPYFTATAANVLYGNWSHDIGGHMAGTLSPELYTRWIQFGVYSPVLRTHASKSSESERRIWHFPDPYRGCMADMLRRRMELAPYIYGQLRDGWDSGVSLLRPMYYDWPEAEEAYHCPGQYQFGDDLLVVPVTRPADPETGLAEVEVWLPPGKWFDTQLGTVHAGGQKLRQRMLLEEVPVFVRPGTVVPEQVFARRLSRAAEELVFRIYPGPSGEACLYEDDGESTDWMRGEGLRLRCSHRKRNGRREIRLHPAEGKYRGCRENRRVRLILEGVAPPRAVEGASARYEGERLTLHLDLGRVNLREGHTVEVEEAPARETVLLREAKGLFRRLEIIRREACRASPAHPRHADERLPVRLAQTGRRISLRPESFGIEMRALRRALPELPRVLREFRDTYDPAVHPSQREILGRALALAEACREDFAAAR